MIGYRVIEHEIELGISVLKVLWDTLNMNNFYFLFLLFSDFIGIFFSFSFLFFWTMKRHVTLQSHDVMS